MLYFDTSFLAPLILPEATSEAIAGFLAGLAGGLPVADIMTADVLRPVDRFGGLAASPACRDYLARATARPAFAKAHANQMAHFAAADRG